ncbi:hypothetical protein MNBD_GAMMA15-2023 [hydrothermal vent metagenome]|uniref:VOC domain-containing protein n=1 Tax=hydrothermal vent metagenome TaxID=652676 RepID=A0A3B0YK22_9ZZZZ
MIHAKAIDHICLWVKSLPEAKCYNDDEFLSKQHLSFEVDSLDEVIETLNEAGISEYSLGEVRFFAHRNYTWCEWRDPNGIRLECVEII